MTWPYSGNTSLTRHVCHEDDVDPADFLDMAEAFGVEIEQPSERERREHRAARTPLVNDPRAADTAEGPTHTEGTSE